MSKNTGLYLKTSFVWKKKEAYNNKWNIYFGAMFFEVRGRIFFTSDNFQGTFVDFRFIIFTKVLMKELTRILIHVHKIFKCTVFFQNAVVNVPPNCWEETLT